MIIIDEAVIVKILNSYYANVANPKVKKIKWTLDTKAVSAGNSHLSKVYKLAIEYQTNGNRQKILVFVKAPSDCPMYEEGSKVGIYVKEETMYTEILPKIHNFEEEYSTPRNYCLDDKHSLFLEDLSQSGYRTADRLKRLDFQHTVHALKSLAKLHAFSVHLEKTSGISEIIRNNPLHHSDPMRIGLEVGQTKFYSHLSPSIQTKYAEKIEFFKTIDWARAMDDLMPEKSSFNVLNHGDYWTNNIMFKYDKYGIIENIKIIDFQLCRWGNPATDLIYFAINSVQYDVYSQYFHLLCTIYLDTLNKILAHFGYPIYEMEALKRDIEARYAFAIAVIITILPIFTGSSDSENAFDLNEAVENNELNITAVHKIYEQEYYMQLATKWFLHFAQKGI